ncbi:MAG: MBOAT family protein [Lachnospiraceae bacterium]|nr:MBOAT family protein [Lachnospiraceae bacterium]
MLFNTREFLLFFPGVVLFYFVLPKRIKNYWLLACSYFFYMCWEPVHVIYLLFCTAVSFLAGIVLDKNRDKKGNRAFLALFVAADFIPLFLFKYLGFLTESINTVLSGIGIKTLPGVSWLLPVGISFYTFQTVSYIVDVYRKETEREKNPFQYALFVSFFPQLVAGPIEHSHDLLPQLKKERPFSYENFRKGMITMAWGFFVKMVIADRISVIVDTVFDDPARYGGWFLILGTFLFSFQIYCDFAGYTTIALGAARILGINLTDNFKAPYLSGNVNEFWNRWHISLQRWFKDYLYIPLGGSRKGKGRTMLNKMIVFLVSGLWHGAAWHFVVWGALNGLYQLIYELIKPLFKKIKKDKSVFYVLWRAASVCLTFVLIAFAWIFFRSKNIETALEIVRSIFTVHNFHVLFDGSLSELGLTGRSLICAAVSLLILVVMDVMKYRDISVGDWILKRKTILRWAIYIILFTVILIFGVYGDSPEQFIYFVF